MLINRMLLLPLGVDSTPIGQRKCLEVAASLVSGLFNTFNQGSANDTNLRMNKQTNEMNYQIAKEANAMSQAQFNENMKWLREQYYDTDQYKRLIGAINKAGLNPALALGNVSPVGSVGQASPSQFHAAQMDAGHVDPVQIGDGLSESIGHAVDAYYNNQLRQAQAENIGVDSQIKRAQAVTEFASRVADIRSKYADIEGKLAQKGVSDATRQKLIAEKDKIDGEIDLFWSTFDEQIKASKYGNRLLDVQGRSAEQDVIGKSIENKFKPALLRANIRLSYAQSRSVIDHLKLIQPQIDSMVAEGKLTDAKTIAEYLMNGQSAIKFLQENHLEEMYNKNGVTKKGRDFFYMLGDLLSHGIVKNLPK